MAALTTRPDLLAILRKELTPYEGRLGASLRIALCCVIVVVVAMSQQIPEAALSCYLIFFAARNNAASGILIALALIVGASVGILLGILFLQLAADEPMARMAFLIAFTVGGMYFSQASKLGPIAATVGFVFAFVMTLYDFVPIAELLSRGLGWMWVVVFVPMAALIFINIVLGPHPAKLVRASVAERLEAVAALADGLLDARDKAEALLAEGTAELASTARLSALMGYCSKDEARRLTASAETAQDILALALEAAPDDMAGLVAPVRSLATMIQNGDKTGSMVAASTLLPRPVKPIYQQLIQLSGVWSGVVSSPERSDTNGGLLRPDAFNNPAYLQFALKTLLAVLITYTIYTAGDWFEIHTAMITCFYVALASTGETLHKAALRIMGCLIGAAMGIVSIIYILPHLTDIGHLMILVAVGSFIAAWVANGSSRIQYMGWQIALAFFLCVLQGYGPSFDIGVATNRIVGIIIGNIVVAFVFLTIWPASVSNGIRAALASGADTLNAIISRQPATLAAPWPHLSEMRRLNELSAFEVARMRRASPLASSPHMLMASEQATHAIVQLWAIRARPRFLAGAPRSVKMATLAFESSAAGFLYAGNSAISDTEEKGKDEVVKKASTCAFTLSRLERLSRHYGLSTLWSRDLNDFVEASGKLQNSFVSLLKAAQ